MKIRPLDIDKMIRKDGLKEVYNHTLEGPGSLFDPNIFGQGEEKKYRFGYIKLNGHFVEPGTYIMVSRRVFRNLPYIINKEKKFIINEKGVLEPNPDGYTGLNWLYENFNKLKFKDKEDAEINKYTRDDFFIDKLPVLPQHYRDINTTEGTIKVDELNQLYIDLIRSCNFKERQKDNKSLDSSFIDMKIQGILVRIQEYLANLTFFKNGAQRRMVMARSVDNSSRTVITANEVRMRDTLGKNKVSLNSSTYPLHHIINMYPIHILNKVQSMLKYFYELGMMKDLSLEEFENYFNDDFIKEKMKAYYYSYKDRSEIITGPNGEQFIFDFEFISNKKKESKFSRGLTWLELFYIAFSQIQESVRTQGVRFPTTGKGSVVLLKPYASTLTVSQGDLKIYHNDTLLYDLPDFCDVTKYIENPVPQIYEETQKISNLLLSALSADFDGDKVITRSVYSENAVKEIDEYNDKPLSYLSVNGENIRDIGKEGIQCIYDLTLAKETELVDGSNEFNQEILEFFTPNREFKLEEIVDLINSHSIYTKVRFKGFNTTLGRVIFNEVIFNHIKDYTFKNETFTSGKCRKLFNDYVSKYLLTKKITSEEFKFALDKYHDLAFGLCDIVASATTLSMLIKDDPVWNKKQEELRKKYNIDKEDFNDPVDMAKYEKEMVEFAKTHYKDDDMYNVYESGAGPKWGVDFKNMKVGLGTQPIPGTTEVSIIKNSLKEGITTEDVMKAANSGSIGAIARGINTQDSGYKVKKMVAAFQSTFIYRGDCKCKKYHPIKDNNPQDLLGRTILDKGKEILIDESNINTYLGKVNMKRTPMKCKSNNGGYCSACAGVMPLDISGSDRINIGLFISEIGSELSNKSMKKVHDLTQKMFTIEDLDEWIKK